jgi:8-oxo-dGTP pyrophosphatase MutT (NUDIX family)/uncharacterized membrane protein
MSVAARVLSPITMGLRDINSLTPRVPSDQFSEQVAQVVGAQDDIARRKKERRDSALKQVLLTTAGGVATGGLLGTLKGAILTGKAWNPAITAGAAAVGGAGALTIALIRRAAAKRMEEESQQTITEAPSSVSYVAGHHATKEKARDWEFARWAPLLGAEGGALIGGIGGLAAAAATAKPGEQTPLTPGLIGAGALGLAGLGLGYLYRKHKQTQFLEHVENELAMSQSPKAQEAAVQAEVEKDPMLKAADAELLAAPPAPAPPAPKRKRSKRLLLQALGYGTAGAGAAAIALPNLAVTPDGAGNLDEFLKTFKTWEDAHVDPREKTRQYSVIGYKALSAPNFSAKDAVRTFRQSPLSPMPWYPTSGAHYEAFQAGPLVAYLHQVREAQDKGGDSGTRRQLANVGGAFETYAQRGVLEYDPAIRPSELSEAGKVRFDNHLRKIFDELKQVIPPPPPRPTGSSRTQPRHEAVDPKAGYPRLNIDTLLPRLHASMSGLSQKLYGTNEVSKLTPVQQETVLNASDRFLRESDPKLWAEKQLFDAGTGVTMYEDKILYPKYLGPVAATRKGLMMTGAALLALGGSALVYSWLKNKKEKKEDEAEVAPAPAPADNVIQFPQEQLEKAASSLVKEALITGSSWPVVSSNAPLLRGTGGAPDRFASCKGGARRVYDFGLGALDAWKAESKPMLEKHVQSEELVKNGEDDPNAHGEELDDVALGMARVLEAQYGSKVKDDPPPSTKAVEEAPPSSKAVSDAPPSEAVVSEAPPSTKVAEVEPDRAALPYRKRVEVIAVKDGQVYGGTYEDGTFGVFGGGLDDDDVESAAEREFREESGFSAKNIRRLPVDPVRVDWKAPYKSAKQAERAKSFRGSETHFVVADFDDSDQQAKAKGEAGKSHLKNRRLYPIDEALSIVEAKDVDPKGYDADGLVIQRTARRKALELARQPLLKAADAAQFLPRKEVLVFTPDGRLAVRRGTNRRFELPSDIEGKPVPYEQPVQLLPEGGIPEKGVHGYQVALQSAEGDLPEGFEGVDPQEALKDLYAALGKPENRAYQSLDRARARALLRLVKKRTPKPVEAA